MQTVAILYICTGDYAVFFNKFYKTAENHFLSDFSKQYFVFTDSLNLLKADNITYIYKKYQGFPLDSLMRFDLFSSIESDIRQFDYTFFLNSNMFFVQTVGIEVLPDQEHSFLTAVKHPSYIHLRDRFYPFERRPWSTAFIPWSCKNLNYYMGSFNGGRTPEYLELIKVCRENVFKDLSRNLIALFHDESHLNKYLSKKVILELDYIYAYPEIMIPNDAVKILMLEKKLLSNNFIKNGVSNSYSKMIRFIKRFIRYVFWLPELPKFFFRF